MAFIVCPFGALLGCILSVLRKGLRDAYDSVIFQLLIKPLGRMPIVDSFAAKRVAGPGMASNYYYQITTEQALAALETAMDLDRLLAYYVSSCKINFNIIIMCVFSRKNYKDYYLNFTQKL